TSGRLVTFTPSGMRQVIAPRFWSCAPVVSRAKNPSKLRTAIHLPIAASFVDCPEYVGSGRGVQPLRLLVPRWHPGSGRRKTERRPAVLEHARGQVFRVLAAQGGQEPDRRGDEAGLVPAAAM